MQSVSPVCAWVCLCVCVRVLESWSRSHVHWLHKWLRGALFVRAVNAFNMLLTAAAAAGDETSNCRLAVEALKCTEACRSVFRCARVRLTRQSVCANKWLSCVYLAVARGEPCNTPRFVQPSENTLSSSSVWSYAYCYQHFDHWDMFL